MKCPTCGKQNQIVNQCCCDPNNLPTCTHNEMVANHDPDYAWKCARCGYVYGITHPVSITKGS